jgi:hypothetical protein
MRVKDGLHDVSAVAEFTELIGEINEGEARERRCPCRRDPPRPVEAA